MTSTSGQVGVGLSLVGKPHFPSSKWFGASISSLCTGGPRGGILPGTCGVPSFLSKSYRMCWQSFLWILLSLDVRPGRRAPFLPPAPGWGQHISGEWDQGPYNQESGLSPDIPELALPACPMEGEIQTLLLQISGSGVPGTCRRANVYCAHAFSTLGPQGWVIKDTNQDNQLERNFLKCINGWSSF